MRTFFLILLLSTFGACGKKSNQINSDRLFTVKEELDNKKEVITNTELSVPSVIPSFVFERALTIPHSGNISTIRSKLLNKIVETSYPSSEIISSHTIQIHDELQNIELTENELKDYEIKEKILTKVIVSFSDREEVYFVQEKILAQDLISILGLKLEENRKLKIVSTPYRETYFGLTFHIVSVNHEDLMLNDQSYYNSDSIISNFQEKIMHESYKKILLKIGYDFKVQSLSPVSYVAPVVRCNKDLKEAGMCGPGCNFTTDLPANDYKKTNPKNLLDIGLVLRYGNKEMRIDQLELIDFREGYFEINLDSINNLNKEATFEFLKIANPVYSGASGHYNFGSGCHSIDKSQVSPYGLNTLSNFSFKMTTFGRGEELKKINL